jgi:hypothetical protein
MVSIASIVMNLIQIRNSNAGQMPINFPVQTMPAKPADVNPMFMGFLT